MRAVHITRAAWVQIRRRLALALVVICVAAMATSSAAYLVADAVARNERTAARLATPDARSIVIRSQRPNEFLLPHHLVAAVADLPGVTHASALGKVESARNILWRSGTEAVGLFSYEVLAGSEPFSLTAGRGAGNHEAIASVDGLITLGISAGAPGRITTESGETLPIVGNYDVAALGAIAELIGATVLTPAAVHSDVLTLVLLVAEPADVGMVASAARSILAGLPANSYTIGYDQRAAEVELTVRSEAQASVRSLALGTVATGAVVISLAALVHTIVRRRDIARQRALGRTRVDVVAIIATQIAALTLVGSSLGTVAAALALDQRSISADPVTLATMVGFVTIIGALSALPAATAAALRDPAIALRVP